MPINQDDIEFTDGDAPLDNINIEIDDDDNAGSDDPLAIGKEESSAEIEAKAEADRLRSELARSNSEREAALRDRKEKEELLEKERQARLVSDETSVNFAVRAITQEIDSLSDRLIRAKEEGNTSDEVKIQREITEKSGELAQAKTVLDTLKNARNNPPKKETLLVKPPERSSESNSDFSSFFGERVFFSEGVAPSLENSFFSTSALGSGRSGAAGWTDRFSSNPSESLSNSVIIILYSFQNKKLFVKALTFCQNGY